jgi:hypothetical protein
MNDRHQTLLQNKPRGLRRVNDRRVLHGIFGSCVQARHGATSVVRVHQHGACIADNNLQDMRRSRGGLTSKVHAVVDVKGLPLAI